jgi:predicted exporter
MRGWLALAWLLLVLALAAQQVDFWRGSRIDSDVMALLPGASGDPLLQAANARMADAGTRQVIVLLSAGGWPATRDASTAFAASIAGDGWLVPASGEAPLDEALEFYGPFRRGMLTPAQRRQMQDQDPCV